MVCILDKVNKTRNLCILPETGNFVYATRNFNEL